jgi:hypothetical protein
MASAAPGYAAPSIDEPAIIEHFRSPHVAVREVGGFSRDVLIITFDSYTDISSLDRPGFGETFLRRRRVDAIHVISSTNRWYQYPEIPKVLEIVRGIAARYDRAITYGSSMGGYAAIRFGACAGASVALAISPQFSIDPEIVPFDIRWIADARTIDFSIEQRWNREFVKTAYIVFDPCNLDRRHTEMFASRTHIVPVEVRNSGHPSTGFLAEIGLLQNLPVDIANGRFDRCAFVAAVRERRRRSALFFSALADRCRDPQRQVSLLRRANQMAPGNTAILMRYGLALCRAGRIAEAKAACDDALARSPDNPVRLCEYSEFLVHIGHWERADTMISDLVARWPSPAYESHLATLHSLLDAERLWQRLRPSPFGTRGTSRRSRWIWRLWKLLPPHDVRPSRKHMPPELRVTTVPAPPPFWTSWRRHLDLLHTLPRGRIELLLVGDSLIQGWPNAYWGAIKTFNFGVAADKTQHTLWRLHQIYPGQLSVQHALIMIGTNNLGADDGPVAIVAGVNAVVKRLRRVAPGVQCWVVEIPPCGPGFSFRNDDRRRANALLHSAASFRSINADDVLMTGCGADCRNYAPDHIHLTDEGYRILTRYVLGTFTRYEGRTSGHRLAAERGD